MPTFFFQLYCRTRSKKLIQIINSYLDFQSSVDFIFFSLICVILTNVPDNFLFKIPEIYFNIL